MTTEKLVAAKVEALWEFLTAYRDRKCTFREAAEDVWDAAVRKHVAPVLPVAPPSPELRWPGVEVVPVKVRVRHGKHELCLNIEDMRTYRWHEGEGGTFDPNDAIRALNDPRTPPPPHVAEKPADASDDGMEERARKFDATTFQSSGGRQEQYNFAVAFARSEVARATADRQKPPSADAVALACVRSERNQLQMDIAAITAERDRLAAENERLKSEIDRANGTIEGMQKGNDMLATRVDVLVKQLKRLKDSSDAHWNRANALEAKLNSLRASKKPGRAKGAKKRGKAK